eukprot:745932-Hanusia_phi.AAC.1
MTALCVSAIVLRSHSKAARPVAVDGHNTEQVRIRSTEAPTGAPSHTIVHVISSKTSPQQPHRHLDIPPTARKWFAGE